MGKEIDIRFKTNLGAVNKLQEGLNKAYEGQLLLQEKIKKSSVSQLGVLKSQEEAWENVRKSTDLSNEQILTIDDNLKNIKKSISNIEDPFERLVRSLIPFGDKLVSQKEKVEGLASSFEKIEKSGGFINTLGDYLANFTQKLKVVGVGMRTAFGAGIQGMITALTAGISGLIPLVAGLLATLAPFLPIVLGIIAVIFVLKRMWVNNIGGMQTMWYQFAGTLKDTWSRFVVSFDKFLRAFSPLLKGLVKTAFMPLLAVIKATRITLDFIFKIFEPIAKAVKDISNAFNEAFGGKNKKQFDAIGFVLKTISINFTLLGKVISFILNVVLKPFVETIKGLIFLIGKVVEYFKRVGEAFKKAFEKSFLKDIWDTFKSMFEFVEKIIGVLDKISGGRKEEKEEKEMNAGFARAQPISTSQVVRNKETTINNNSSVVVHSSGEISKENAPFIGNIISSSLSKNAKIY